MKNSKDCVDDTILYKNSVKENFRNTCSFLTLELNSVGFWIKENGVKPGIELLEQ